MMSMEQQNNICRMKNNNLSLKGFSVEYRIPKQNITHVTRNMVTNYFFHL